MKSSSLLIVILTILCFNFIVGHSTHTFELSRKNELIAKDKLPKKLFSINKSIISQNGGAKAPISTAATLKPLVTVAVASFCAAAIMYPVDLVRALQMANAGSGVKQSTLELLSAFQKTHGTRGFFTQGLGPELARATWMRFVKFGLFPIVHKKVSGGLSEAQGSPFTRAVAGILSSVPEAISIMPLEVAKIALQLDSEKKLGNNMFRAMSYVYKDKGLGGLFYGYVGVQYRQSAWTGAYFASIKIFDEYITKMFKCIFGNEFKIKENRAALVFTQFLSGFLAGMFGAVINTPGDTIRSSMQKTFLSGSGKTATATFLGTGQAIVKSRGFQGLYAGFGFKAMHLGGGGALMAFLIPFFNKLYDEYFL